MTDIKVVIDELLKEEIGKHFLDSGGAYGYQYEKNREKGYLTGMNPVEEYTDEDCKERTLEVTIPVFDLLTYNLEKDDKTIKLEKTLYHLFDEYEINPWGIWEVQDFLETHAKILLGIQPTRIMKMEWVNTYNYEEYISQTLQYIPFAYDYEHYILLQVHGGCDVRGGTLNHKYLRLKIWKNLFMGNMSAKLNVVAG